MGSNLAAVYWMAGIGLGLIVGGFVGMIAGGGLGWYVTARVTDRRRAELIAAVESMGLRHEADEMKLDSYRQIIALGAGGGNVSEAIGRCDPEKITPEDARARRNRPASVNPRDGTSAPVGPAEAAFRSPGNARLPR